jgi:enterochelin esterase-like enzyme
LAFRVYLPPCFDASLPETSAVRYPVLYLIHGQTFADDQWERLGIGAAADALIQAGTAPPFLIVLPREADTFADIYLSSFRQDVIEGLIPWMDANYPTCTARACRAIGGLSRGGAWAIHLGFSNWILFGAIGAHSTPPFNTDARLLPGWLAQIPEGQAPRIYMDAGRRDPYLQMASAFEQQLTEVGVAHEWYLFNGQHDEAYWAAHAADYLAWYTRPWMGGNGS